MSIKIEKGIPIPSHFSRSKFPKLLKEMNFGDSLLVDEDLRQNIRTAANYWGINVVTRKESDGKVRVWKIKKESE